MDLTKQLYFNAENSTTVKEITELANELLATTWTLQVYRFKDEESFNLKDLGWTFRFENTRRSAGRCSPRSKEIRLSMYLFQQNHSNAVKWEDTLRHELAHALDYCLRNKSNHDNHWKAVARAILSNGERCYSSSDIQDNNSRYTLSCPDEECDYTRPSHKKRKVGARSHPCCSPCYNNTGKYVKLVQTQNY